MKVLITGGTGLVGSSLVLQLQQLGVTDITVLTRNVSRARKLLGDKVHLLTVLDIDDIDGQDVVVNLQGESIANKRWSAKQKNKICQSRLVITEQLSALIKAAKHPPHTFISGSAIGYYGRQNGQIINEDNTTPHDEFTHQLCRQWEQKTQAAEKKSRVVILRTGIVLDAIQGALPQMAMPFKIGLGGYIGDGQQFLSWIHIDDMVSAIMHIIDNPALSGPINMTAPKAETNKAFNKVLGETLGSSCWFKTPAFLIKCLFGEMSDLFLYGQNVQPKALLDSGFTFKHPTLSAALRDLYNKPR
jgi:hypothetical protein